MVSCDHYFGGWNQQPDQLCSDWSPHFLPMPSQHCWRDMVLAQVSNSLFHDNSHSCQKLLHATGLCQTSMEMAVFQDHRCYTPVPAKEELHTQKGIQMPGHSFNILKEIPYKFWNMWWLTASTSIWGLPKMAPTTEWCACCRIGCWANISAWLMPFGFSIWMWTRRLAPRSLGSSLGWYKPKVPEWQMDTPGWFKYGLNFKQ